MLDVDVSKFHDLKGKVKRRMVYQKKDFFDYLIMLVFCSILSGSVYGWTSTLSVFIYILCAFMLVSFVIRHGFSLSVPIIFKRPQDVVLMFYYKLKNMHTVILFAMAFLLLENLIIYLTPGLPHMTDFTREAAIWLFFIHFIGFSIYRTVILFDHLRKKDKVQAFLMETQWKRKVNTQFGLYFEIFHGYLTGLLTHIVLLIPWYFVITTFHFSVLLMPLVCWINLLTAKRFMGKLGGWYYREHWLGHNHEFDFVYLHGPHHDALPSGMIAVAGNGFLEGVARYTFGIPHAFYNPLISFFNSTIDIKNDIDMHQYIPGVFPKLDRDVHDVFQHSLHHLGKLEPYGVGLKLDHPGASEKHRKMAKKMPESLHNSIGFDEKLNGYKWDNAAFRKYIKLYDKYND
ncbi:hypothetical protein A7985_22650 [Pseudoalteromonas luteoviolacea]|uniref:Fatty acid hydroxylase domain-containing protein n=3 Tax=Pseudoalteromonas luteoviolacea TaxID=43657 RepID=A0A1C0TKC7_9GAMM|nr:hypothetical protein A7985_22650 [Pseudoalteromonas luteoviolacea]